MDVVFSTERGIEDFLKKSLRGKGKIAPLPLSFKGRVFLKDTDPLSVAELLYTNPFYHKAYMVCEAFDLSLDRGTLDYCYLKAKESDIVDLLTPTTTFGVRCIRRGTHPFTSQDVASYVGAGIIDGCRMRRGFRPTVNLTDPDLMVIADVANNKAVFGLELVGSESMHRRGWRVYEHPASLKSTLANALIALTGYNHQKSLWDPMCGSGTIPIEAAHRCIGLPTAFFRKENFLFLRTGLIPVPIWREITRNVDESINWKKRCCIHGSDHSPKHINGARINAESALVEGKIHFSVCKVKEFTAKERIDCIACNPPYGIRMGNPQKAKKALEDLFITFCESSASHLALIHPDKEEIENLTLKYSLFLDKATGAYNGNVKVYLFSIRR